MSKKRQNLALSHPGFYKYRRPSFAACFLKSPDSSHLCNALVFKYTLGAFAAVIRRFFHPKFFEWGVS